MPKQFESSKTHYPRGLPTQLDTKFLKWKRQLE